MKMNKCYVVHESVIVPGEFEEFKVKLFKNKESAQKYKKELTKKLLKEYDNYLEAYIKVWIKGKEIED